MYVGSHVSISRGYEEAAKHAVSLGASAFQYFPKNPRSLVVKKFNKSDALRCAEFCLEHKVKSIAHTPYPTKLIPENEDIQSQVIESLKNDLEIAEACGSIGVVVHFGSTATLDAIEAYTIMINNINRVLEHWDGDAMLLIENNAGAGSEMGITLEEMVQIRNLTEFPEKIGFCFDTCHAFASGLWSETNWETFVEKADELGYFEHLKAIHINDSKYPYGQRKDRHANILKGHMLKSQWEQLLSHDIVKGIPLVLETPKDNGVTHKEEIQLLKTFLQ
ncbi:deoxyribonuclease IV [Bacillus alkalicellulosilyticus]|uniref:deoxyribonuclease IV n=1 Tax=Alkalihalobacterium alkalicellulosilyticum TaxID=1912214 RepID=UPI00099838FF|nr:deoxyribonuclease IV [Bacillus alkalicellulosilyticus]